MCMCIWHMYICAYVMIVYVYIWHVYMSMCVCIYVFSGLWGRWGKTEQKYPSFTQHFKLRVPRTLTHSKSPDHTDEPTQNSGVLTSQMWKTGLGEVQGCRGELKLETSSLPTSRSFSREQLVQRRGKCEAGTHLSLWKQKDQPHSLPSESAQFSWVPMSVFVWCSAMTNRLWFLTSEACSL